MAQVVVIGAGLGGLPTAYELRHLLPAEHTVTLIAEQPDFTFIPGLIRVALDLDPLDHMQLPLAPLAERHGFNLVTSPVTHMDLQTQQITVADGRTIAYDYVAIATGASLAFDQIPGLGPHGGYTHSVAGGHLLCGIRRNGHSLCGGSGHSRSGHRSATGRLCGARPLGGVGQGGF